MFSLFKFLHRASLQLHIIILSISIHGPTPFKLSILYISSIRWRRLRIPKGDNGHISIRFICMNTHALDNFLSQSCVTITVGKMKYDCCFSSMDARQMRFCEYISAMKPFANCVNLIRASTDHLVSLPVSRQLLT